VQTSETLSPAFVVAVAVTVNLHQPFGYCFALDDATVHVPATAAADSTAPVVVLYVTETEFAKAVSPMRKRIESSTEVFANTENV
jgi:hypothetical protein